MSKDVSKPVYIQADRLCELEANLSTKVYAI